MIPKKVFFTKGVGVHKDKLASFELALRKAGIEKCNLVYVSSILPPKCKLLPVADGLKELKAGGITFCVMARNETNEPNRLISAAIGWLFRKILKRTDICQSIKPSGKPMKKQGIMRRIWQQQCSLQLLVWTLTLTRHGRKGSMFTSRAERFSLQEMCANLPRGIKRGIGQPQ